MSFLDKIAGSSRKTESAVVPDIDQTPPPPLNNPMEETMRIGGPGSILPDQLNSRGDSSIISEAAPSELAAEFSETRMPGDMDDSSASGLPIIGAWPTARQQRVLLGLFGAGLLGLILIAVAGADQFQPWRVAGGRRRPGADAVAAAGEVGVAGPAGRRGRIRRGEGKRRRAGAQRAQPVHR